MGHSAPWGSVNYKDSKNSMRCPGEVTRRADSTTSGKPRSWVGRENLVAPGKRGALLQGRRDGAVFLVTELDGVLDGGVIESAAQAIEHFELGPYGGRLGRALAGTNHFQRFQLLPLFLQHDNDVGGRASSQRQEQQLHRTGRRIGLAIGIDRDAVTRRANGHKFLSA